ncbi:hypothetical protein QQX09_12200 [Demequina sp. SYSU T00192]|uniref:Uncharacterized protein n=1 Tax=Demequina litoralis TaxID=3051660 RepID=A0ABT8GCA2_9MICO|nr:hypothetical protein [Demequina sp. SYSU T00192]MDN4476619.1 hypothetical protein [Demequina sp. SYSU T00192]
MTTTAPRHPGALRDEARRADKRRLCAVLDSIEPAEIAERDALLARVNSPTVERLMRTGPVERDARYGDGPLATLGAQARAAALTTNTQETHA